MKNLTGVWFATLCLLLLLCGMVRPGHAGDGHDAAIPDGPIRLLLQGAIQQDRTDPKSGERHVGEPVTLILETTLADGAWGAVLGLAPDFNRGHHRGRILESGMTEDGGYRLLLEMRIAGDPWVPGGRGVYTVTIRPDGNGGGVGSFTGTFLGRERKGRVLLESVEQQPARGADTLLLSTERPRLLFAAEDRDTLLARRAHPVIAAAWERIEAEREDPVALGVLYQLTGDATHADRAWESVQTRMADHTPGPFNLGQAWGGRLADVALAYDLCHAAWTPEIRARVRGYIAWVTERLILRPNSVSRKVNWSPNNNYHAVLRGGAAIGALAIAGDPGAAPRPPVDPGEDAIPVIPPETRPQIEGVTASPFLTNQFIPAWHWTGAFPTVDAGVVAILRDLGIRIEADTNADTNAESTESRATSADGETVWAPLPTAHLQTDRHGVAQHFNLRAATKDAFGHVALFHGQFHVEDEPLLLRLDGNEMNATSTYWINGEPIRAGAFLRLHPGTHACTVLVRMGRTNAWGGLWFGPRFLVVTEEAMRDELQKRQTSYALALHEYAEDVATWNATAGADPHILYLHALGQLHMRQYYRYAMGDGGYQTEGEGYTGHSNPLPLLYATLHQRLYGSGLTGRPDVSHFLPRYVMTMIWDVRGRVRSQSFSIADGHPAARHFARAFPVVPASYQPAVLWTWNRLLGLSPDGAGVPSFHSAQEAVYTFLHYPVDMDAQNPSGILPRTWAATTKGAYIFRNGWEGADDIVTQVFLKREGEGGWHRPDAGSIRIAGLGHVWAAPGVDNPKAGYRWNEPVVMLPDDDINEGMRAALLGASAEADGSGVVTMDMRHVYMGRLETEDSTPEARRYRPLVRNTFELIEENLRDLGIRGTRSVGVDYSGAAGVPAVFAVADAIHGGGRKVWLWHIPPRAEVTVEGNRFVIRQGDATLAGTVIAPVDAQVVHASQIETIAAHRVKLKSADSKDKVPAVRVDAIRVTGGANETAGDFVVIMTLQKGDAPVVEWKGEGGLEADAQVGALRIQVRDGAVAFERPASP